jgi:hypothetical protein
VVVTLRLLVVEPDTEDLLFLQEALNEIEGGRHWGNWVPSTSFC